MKKEIFIKKNLSYLKDRRFGSILIKYLFLLFICLVLPLVVVNYLYMRALEDNTQREMIQTNEKSLEEAYESVNSVIQANKKNAYEMSNDRSAQFLTTLDSVKTDRTGNTELLWRLLNSTKKLNDYVENFAVYFRKSDQIIYDSGVADMEEYANRDWLETYLVNPSDRLTFQARKRNGQYPYLLTITYPINAREGGDDGVVVIDLNVEKIGNYLGRGDYKKREDESILIVTSASMDTLIYCDEYMMLRKDFDVVREIAEYKEALSEDSIIGEIQGVTCILSARYSKQDGFWYIQMKQIKEYEEQVAQLRKLFRSIALAMGLICFVLAFLLASWVYRPIRKTMQLLDELSMLTEWDSDKHADEMALIQKSIFSVNVEREKMREQINERMISLKNAQMCALQAQINPHFLYNTLQSIGNAVALLNGGNNQATEMIYALGKLMRISLSGDKYFVTLAEELEHVKLYTKLLDFRFRNRIRLYIEIPEEMLQEKVPKLTLQPLIENAVQHGFEDKNKKGSIWIRGERKGKQSKIYVIDNGKGMSEQDMCIMQEQLNLSSMKVSNHVGLRNVNQRLQLIYGEAGGLELIKPKEEGFCVAICYTSL